MPTEETYRHPDQNPKCCDPKKAACVGKACKTYNLLQPLRPQASPFWFPFASLIFSNTKPCNERPIGHATESVGGALKCSASSLTDSPFRQAAPSLPGVDALERCHRASIPRVVLDETPQTTNVFRSGLN